LRRRLGQAAASERVRAETLAGERILSEEERKARFSVKWEEVFPVLSLARIAEKRKAKTRAHGHARTEHAIVRQQRAHAADAESAVQLAGILRSPTLGH